MSGKTKIIVWTNDSHYRKSLVKHIVSKHSHNTTMKAFERLLQW